MSNDINTIGFLVVGIPIISIIYAVTYRVCRNIVRGKWL